MGHSSSNIPTNTQPLQTPEQPHSSPPSYPLPTSRQPHTLPPSGQPYPLPPSGQQPHPLPMHFFKPWLWGPYNQMNNPGFLSQTV